MTDATRRNISEALRDRQAAQREASRAAILEGAAEAFIAGGFAATSMTAVAARAGVSPATIYKVFGNKRAVFRAMVDRELAQARAPVLDHDLDFKTPRDALRFMARVHRAAFENSRIIGLTRLALAEAERFPEFEDLYRTPEGRDPTQVLGEAVMTTLVERGLFTTDRVDFAVRQFLGMLNQAIIHEPYSTGRTLENLEEYIESCIDVIADVYGADVE